MPPVSTVQPVYHQILQIPATTVAVSTDLLVTIVNRTSTIAMELAFARTMGRAFMGLVVTLVTALRVTKGRTAIAPTARMSFVTMEASVASMALNGPATAPPLATKVYTVKQMLMSVM